jgi:acetyl esterase/lipase
MLEHTPGDGTSTEGGSYLRRVLSLEYRLACAPPGHAATPFPGALFDALAAYDYLVNTVGFAPEDIIVEGDSAGGNLSLALVRYLIEQREFLSSISSSTGSTATTTGAPGSKLKKALLPPGGLILFSPWCDLGTSHDHPASYTSYFARTDYIWNMPRSTAKWGQEVYAGPLGLKVLDTNPWTSPASKHVKHVKDDGRNDQKSEISFSGFPRTFVVCGGVEYLAPAIRTLKERLAADIGESEGAGVTYYEAEDAIHDYCAALWFEPKRTETLKVVGRWIAEM